MEFCGQFETYARDFFTNSGRITFSCEGIQTGLLEELRDKKLTIIVSKFKKKRSLTANAYYWLLINKMAAKLQISNNYCHNMMLRRYGAIEKWDGQFLYVFLADTDDMQKTVDEAETAHLKPTSQVIIGKKGESLRMYYYMKGSHTYNTDEMARLIDGTVDEAQHLGIQTLPPEDVERLVQTWRPRA